MVRWTDEETAQIVQRWPTATREEMLAALPGRTWEAIRSRARIFKVRKADPEHSGAPVWGSNLNRWRTEEDEFLQSNWATATQAELLTALPGRTWGATTTRASFFKLLRPHGLGPCGKGSRPQPDDKRAPPSATKWTTDRLELLSYLYVSAPRRILELAFPFASSIGIEKRAQKAGLVRAARHQKPHAWWTSEHDDKLRVKYPHATKSELLGDFPEFTWKAIELHASRLGVRRIRRWDLPPGLTPEPGEFWRAVPEFRDRYWVSTSGRVAWRRGLMNPLMSRHGHLTVWLKPARGSRTSRLVSRLVLSTFADAPAGKSVPAYRDGDPHNLSLSNLIWRPASVRTSKVEPRTKPPVIGERHRYTLNQNACWSAASSALASFMLSPQDRDDVTTDMIVAHLAGMLALEEFGAKARDFVRDHNRNFGRIGVVSLEQMVRGTEDLRLGDTFSEDEYRERWEALRAS